MILTHEIIRDKFLKFFINRDHKHINESSLIPYNDSSLLFVNSGMIQFKNIFLGLESTTHSKIVTIQKCIRAGGKHNDFDNIGYTNRHHIFFEMLGNFSFNEYTRIEACQYAWSFLINEMKLDPLKIRITIFEGNKEIPRDHETEHVWKNIIKIPSEHISFKDKNENFWSMGDQGPCGPSTEIHYIINNELLEIWNLVFIEYNKDKKGILIKLPNLCIDTGMGLERLCTAVNNHNSNYNTDLFLPIVKFISIQTKIKYEDSHIKSDISIRIISDHIRSIIFLIINNILPGNDGREYILRKIIRRALRHSATISKDKKFINKVCCYFIDIYSNTYKELKNKKKIINTIIKYEQEIFQKTIKKGILLLDHLFSNKNKKLKNNTIEENLFHLYETYGLHPDFMQNIIKEYNIKINWNKFHIAQELHVKKSKSILLLKKKKNINIIFLTSFFIRNKSILKRNKILFLFNNKMKTVNKINTGEIGIIILNKTIFYPTYGGQIGDSGFIYSNNNIAKIIEMKKIKSVILHKFIMLKGIIESNDIIEHHLDYTNRKSIASNHTATHILNAALKAILGNHVMQKGSMINHNKLRFDFSHFKTLSTSTLYQIELFVNKCILQNIKIIRNIIPLSKSYKIGASSLFNEKYANIISTIQIGRESLELCGGTHVKLTGNIGIFKISNEKLIASGIRRIEANTGTLILNKMQYQTNLLNKIKTYSKSLQNIDINIKNIFLENKKLKIENINLKKIENSKKIKLLLKNGIIINNIFYLIHFLKDNNLNNINKEINKNEQIYPSIIIIGNYSNILNKNKYNIIININKSMQKKINANDIAYKLNNILNMPGKGNIKIARISGTSSYSLSYVKEKINEEIKKIINNII